MSASVSNVEEESIQVDAQAYMREYTRGMQFVFNRVQHHVHKLTKERFVPLKACRLKKASEEKSKKVISAKPTFR